MTLSTLLFFKGVCKLLTTTLCIRTFRKVYNNGILYLSIKMVYCKTTVCNNNCLLNSYIITVYYIKCV